MGLLSELNRRNVFRVAVAYLAAAWLVTEVAGTLFPAFGIPGWGVRFIVILFALGFLPTLVFSWAYELTPEGLKREKDVVREKSISDITAKRLDRITISLIVAALIFLVADRFLLPQRYAEPPVQPVATARAASSSIAVLPFVNMSDDVANEYFSDGISEEILNVLSRVEGLNVASRTSSFSFKGEGRSLSEIAEALNVSYVLEGSVRKSENTVRITAQLIEAPSDRHVWSESFDRNLDDIFAIQSDIANAIVAALEGSLNVGESGEIRVSIATSDMSAYDLYLEARELFRARKDLLRSVALFERVVDMDPGFVSAWEELSAVYSVMPSWMIVDRDYHNLSYEAATKAIELDENLSLAYSVIAWFHHSHWPYRWTEALENYSIAADNDPRNATNFLWRAFLYLRAGYLDSAMADLDRCLDIDPLYSNCLRIKSSAHVLRGETDKGVDLFLHTLESGVPGNAPVFVPAFALKGNRAAALLQARNYTGNTGAPIKEWIDLIQNPNMDKREARQALERWVEREDIDINNYWPLIVAFGVTDASPKDSYAADLPVIWVPEHREYRQSAHFKEVVRELDLEPFWRENGFPPQCRPVGQDDFECD